jgi:hypothetical protein
VGCCGPNNGFRGSLYCQHVAGKLDSEIPHNPHLICSEVLHHTNHSTLARFVNDGLKVSWPTGVHAVLILYSDAAAYMLKAATVLKVFYPNLIHFTCLAHGRKHVAEEVRAKFPQEKLILMTKKCFRKPHIKCNPISGTCQMHPPPKPVPTR